MEEISGTRPENLPITEDINLVKPGLKKAQKEFAKLDKPNPTKLLTAGKGSE